ncbi:MAG: IS4 family transposase, partial [Phycisphaerae bacterium]|nr:IS4 family transposase [Phycisphaerae bacterium]
MVRPFRAAVAMARRQGQLYFAALLPEDRILKAFGTARAIWQGWVYTPAVTVWVFLSQCLSADHSCREAVSRLIAWRVAQDQQPCSAETGAYCTARGNLPEEAIHQLVRDTGKETEAQADESWLWLGRRVRVVDGSTITMPDTPANQGAYPQQENQKPGCGFPMARILVIFSLAVGTVLDAAIGRYQGKQTGENSLFRALHEVLSEGDVALADRYFSGWFDIALPLARGIDVVVRKHQARETDFRTGRRLGQDDHLVCWSKPGQPKWMSAEQYAALPEELTLREVRIHVAQKGFRTRWLVVVTTLVDAKQYPPEAIALLYRWRWQAELHLRSLKTVLQMDHLRCKTPERVRNEFYTHLLGYNLLRGVMAAAAFQSGKSPWQISFKGTLQTLEQFLPILMTSVSSELWCATLLTAVATHVVGDRPDRFEPRLVKRRPKPYKHLR